MIRARFSLPPDGEGLRRSIVADLSEWPPSRAEASLAIVFMLRAPVGSDRALAVWLDADGPGRVVVRFSLAGAPPRWALAERLPPAAEASPSP